MSNQELVSTEQAAEEPEVVDEAAAEQASADNVEAKAAAAASQPEAAATDDSSPDSSPSAKEAPSADESAADDEADSLTIHSLEPGQKLAGKVKNITSFGAFVDIGLAQDGLVHISELAKRKVDKVQEVVSAGDEIEVWVKKVDTRRGRISLTMIRPVSLRIRDIEEGAELTGTVTRLESYGAFVDIGSERDGLVHISQITHDYIKQPGDVLSVEDKVQVKVLKVNRKKRQIDLSMKALTAPPETAKKEESVARQVEQVSEPADESAPTAMALALAAAMQSQEEESDKIESNFSKIKQESKKELDEIITRTLATSD